MNADESDGAERPSAHRAWSERGPRCGRRELPFRPTGRTTQRSRRRCGRTSLFSPPTAVRPRTHARVQVLTPPGHSTAASGEDCVAEHSVIDGEINEKIAEKIFLACVAHDGTWKKALDSSEGVDRHDARAAHEHQFVAASSRGAVGGSLRSTEITRYVRSPSATSSPIVFPISARPTGAWNETT